MRLTLPLALLAVAALAAVVAWNPSFRATPPDYVAALAGADTPAERGIATFAFGNWDATDDATLRTSATPWKLVNATMALQAGSGTVPPDFDIAALYRSFGFHSPNSFANWPASAPRPMILSPVGQSVGTGFAAFPPVGATLSNIGCAACHSSVTYDADGAPDTGRVWLGAPNGSINLQAFTDAIFTSVRDDGQDADTVMGAVAALYPDTDWRERLTLRHFVLPELQRTVAEADAAQGALLPFRASLAGATNGLDSLRNRLGLIPHGTVLTESIFNSVPDLGGRLWRTKLLNSGTYAIPGIDHDATITAADITPEHRLGLAGIIAYFTVPSMGVTEEVAETNIATDALDITAWMAVYTPMPFPTDIDRTLAYRGRALYDDGCASCHGTYDTVGRLTSFPNWEGDIGTDPARAALLTPEIADAVNGGLFGQYIDARTVDTYTAPPLTGIWSSAPYFHNGSVPTLWHLMRPDTRPATFQVGGHRYDLDRVGIDLSPPDGYVPWSIPATVDTTAFGLSNAGHESEFTNLSDSDRDALLEYLKTL